MIGEVCNGLLFVLGNGSGPVDDIMMPGGNAILMCNFSVATRLVISDTNILTGTCAMELPKVYVAFIVLFAGKSCMPTDMHYIMQ